MSVLGTVENGWFARLSHVCQTLSQATLNFVSCGNHLGDKLYSNMEAAANNYVDSLNQHMICQALANGATSHQALSKANAALERIANPQNVGELADLSGHGLAIAEAAVGNTVKQLIVPSADATVIPLLLSVGAIGGLYLVGDALLTSSPTIPRRRSHMGI